MFKDSIHDKYLKNYKKCIYNYVSFPNTFEILKTYYLQKPSV